MANSWLLCSSISLLYQGSWSGTSAPLYIGSGYDIYRINFPALSTISINPANITGVNIELQANYNVSNFSFTSYLHTFTGTNYYDGVIGQSTINTTTGVYSIIPFSAGQLSAIKNYSSVFYLTIGSSTGFAGFTGMNNSLNRPSLNITYSDASMNIKVSGAWKSGIPHIKVSGAWKEGVGHIKVGGAWKTGV